MDCIFCKILNKKIPAEFIFKNKKVAVFKDINPKAKIHVLVVPFKHIATLNDIKRSDRDLTAELIDVAIKIAKKIKINSTGYRLVLNCGPDGGQIVNHIHLHILGGEKLGPKRDF